MPWQKSAAADLQPAPSATAAPPSPRAACAALRLMRPLTSQGAGQPPPVPLQEMARHTESLNGTANYVIRRYGPLRLSKNFKDFHFNQFFSSPPHQNGIWISKWEPGPASEPFAIILAPWLPKLSELDVQKHKAECVEQSRAKCHKHVINNKSTSLDFGNKSFVDDLNDSRVLPVPHMPGYQHFAWWNPQHPAMHVASACHAQPGKFRSRKAEFRDSSMIFQPPFMLIHAEASRDQSWIFKPTPDRSLYFCTSASHESLSKGPACLALAAAMCMP